MTVNAHIASITADVTSEKKGPRVDGVARGCAYTSILHGDSSHFFMCALMVGHFLKKYSSEDRVLLVAGHGSSNWFHNSGARDALAEIWTHVLPARLIHAPNGTKVARHIDVFTKIEVLRLPYERLLFLDLDVVIRGDLSSLFVVQAPAGVLHAPGNVCTAQEHGELILAVDHQGKDVDYWCINAGVMRIDPLPTQEERDTEVDRLIHEIELIDEPTCLPEQYWLVKHYHAGAWRHIRTAWNLEVGPCSNAPESVWPRRPARRASRACRPAEWFDISMKQAQVFHFSGTHHKPWNYAHLSASEAFELLDKRWQTRDARGLIAVATREWLEGFREIQVRKWACTLAGDTVMSVVRVLQQKAKRLAIYPGPLQNLKDLCKCHSCKLSFWHYQGRWLTGWEGWWLCEDCILGYVLNVDSAPSEMGTFPHRTCDTCGRGDRSGSFKWPKNPSEESCAPWLCRPCGRKSRKAALEF